MTKLSAFMRHVWILSFLAVLSVSIVIGFTTLRPEGRMAGSPATALNGLPSPTVVLPYPGPASATSPVSPTALPSPTPDTRVTLPPVPMPPSTYISTELTIATVGSAPGQIGVEGREGDPSGPPGFTTDAQGNIYVIDRVNGRVNKYDASWKFASSFTYDRNAVSPDFIAVWNDGSVFLADETQRFDASGTPPISAPYQEVNKYGAEGRLLATYRWPGVSHIERLRIDPNGLLWAEAIGDGTDFVMTQLGTVDGPLDGPAVSARQQHTMLLPQGIAWFGNLQHSPDGKSAVWSARLEDGRTINLQSPIHPNGAATLNGLFVIDTDGAGNIYCLLTYFWPESQAQQRVVVYNKQGDIVGQFPVPPISYYYAPRFSDRVDDQGRVYQMFVLKDVVKIVRWERTGQP